MPAAQVTVKPHCSCTLPALPAGRAFSRATANTTPLPRSWGLLLLVLVLLVGTEPRFKEAANRRRALGPVDPRRRGVPDGVGSEEAHPRVKVAAQESLFNLLFHLPPTLDQIGGRGFLRPHPDPPT